MQVALPVDRPLQKGFFVTGAEVSETWGLTGQGTELNQVEVGPRRRVRCVKIVFVELNRM